MKKFIKKTLILLPLLPFVIWIAALLRCDLLTLLHIDEFKNIEEINTKGTNIEEININNKLRILNYSNNETKIYCIREFETDRDSYKVGIIYDVISKDGQWTFDKYDVIWSGRGTADGFVWPYIR